MDSFEHRVRSAVADAAGIPVPEIKAETNFIADLGLDSLELTALLLDLENEFNVPIPDDEAQTMRTVGDVLRYLKVKC